MEQTLSIGNLCNNNCKYCKDKTANKSLMMLKEELNKFDKSKYITITGGEPCIHKDFLGLMGHMKKEGYEKIKIVSNGRIFAYPDFLEKFAEFGLKHFCIKMPAFDNKTYSTICKSANGLEQAIRGMENIKKIQNTVLDILIRLCKENEQELMDIVMAVSTLEVNKIILDLENTDITNDLRLKISEIADICGMNRTGFEVKNSSGDWTERKVKKIKLGIPDIQFKINADGNTSVYTGADPRIIPASETVKKAREVINYTNFGSIEPLCENPNGIYIYQLNKKSSDTLDSLSAQYGKGINKEQALASGYMEIIERYSACIKKEHYKEIIYADYEQISDYAIPLSKFNIIQPLPFYNREGASMKESYLPSYTDNAWVWAYSLGREKPVLVPAALVYMEFATRDGKYFTHSKALGLGAGNCVEEAIIHGINEWVESDSFGSLPRDMPLSRLDKIPVLDLDSVSDMPQDVAKIKDSIFCFYISSAKYDFKIHTFMPTIFFKKSDGGMLCISGLASNLNPRLAFNRAVSELIESCYRSDSWHRADGCYCEKAKADSCICHRAVANPLTKKENILVKSEDYNPEKLISFEDLINHSKNSIHQDYLFYREMLNKQKLELIVRDLTMEKINIPVIRVLIPGLMTTLLKDQVNFKQDSFEFFK